MPRPMSAFLLFAVIAGGPFAGCSGASKDPADVRPAGPGAPASSNGSASQADDPPGALACGKAVVAVRDATLMSPGVVADITTAAGTADAPVADAARELSSAYTRAVAAHGAGGEPDAVAAVSAAAADMVEICDDSGLETAG